MPEANDIDHLSKRINARDKAAVREVYELYFKPCAAIVMRDGGTQDNAREIFQGAMISLLTKMESPAFLVHNVKSYLYQSCFNLWVKYKKTGRLVTSIENIEDFAETADNGDAALAAKLEQEENYRKMYDCIVRMKPDCKQLLTLTFFEKKPDMEIAPIMKYQIAFVKNKRQRCMKSLRNCVGLND